MHIRSGDSVWHVVASRPRAMFGATVVVFLVLMTIANLGTIGTDTLHDGLARGPAPWGASTVTDGLEGFLGPVREYEDGFTLVSPTFNRSHLLAPFFRNYASGDIPSLKRIVMLWNDPDAPSPELLASLARHPTEIIIEERHLNSKNERFRLSDNMRTAAVFAVDDDMRFAPADIELGYQAWRDFGQGRRRMVGFISRDATPDGEYFGGGDDQPSYSMVLTKGAFIHIDWMRGWWRDDEEARTLREYVDSRKLPVQYPDLKTNCEDIVMSFLYAHHSRLPPVYVKVPFEDDGLGEGISTHPGHYEARTECVRHLKRLMGNDTLISTSMYIDRMRNASAATQ